MQATKIPTPNSMRMRRRMPSPLFRQQTKTDDDKILTPLIIKRVKTSGELNLSNRGLANVPDKLFRLDELGVNDVDVRFNVEKAPDEQWWNQVALHYLDLSMNCIAELPANISALCELTVLNLQHNNLQTLPKEIRALTKLMKLFLNHNRLRHVPDEFFMLTELRELNLSHNELTEMSAKMSDLVMLGKLDCSNNKLTAIPLGIGYLVRLTELNLNDNQLTHLPADIVNLRALKKLDVSKNQLTTLPKMEELRKLEFLYAQHNRIDSVPDFYGCTNIQEIFLGDNCIKEISGDFCENVIHLKKLDLRDNQLETLPNEVINLQNLIRLDLTNNAITQLPNSLGYLPHLSNLQLDGNKIQSIRRDIIQSGTIRILKFLRDSSEVELTIPANKSSQIPEDNNRMKFPDRYVMRNNQSLFVTMKALTDIPESVFQDAKLADVKIVDLCGNKLQTIPLGLKLIATNLTELNLSKNHLETIPECVSECSKLAYLNLGENRLSTLPECLGSMIMLRELILAYNRFQHIPRAVYEMIGLEILLVNNNQVEELDVTNGLKSLKRLAVLDVSNNNISHVPAELGAMKQLRSVELFGNCFRTPRQAILEKGTDSVLCWLRDRMSQA